MSCYVLCSKHGQPIHGEKSPTIHTSSNSYRHLRKLFKDNFRKITDDEIICSNSKCSGGETCTYVLKFPRQQNSNKPEITNSPTTPLRIDRPKKLKADWIKRMEKEKLF